LTLSHIYAVIQIKLINPMNIKKKKKNKWCDIWYWNSSY
jgi:hypothetical protein